MLRVSTRGVTSSPANPTATHRPDVATVAPAVLSVRTTDWSTGTPRASSSRKRRSMSNE